MESRGASREARRGQEVPLGRIWDEKCNLGGKFALLGKKWEGMRWDKGKARAVQSGEKKRVPEVGINEGKNVNRSHVLTHKEGWLRENNDSNQADFRSLSLFAQVGLMAERKRYREREYRKSIYLFYTTSVAGSIVQLTDRLQWTKEKQDEYIFNFFLPYICNI